jgi:MocE subfamily Rieske [2Fe-2S] domain protein
MNDALYEIASFMVLRESTRWRWSHARHHSDTIIVGRDPEIGVTRPPNWLTLLLRFFGVNTTWAFLRGILLHCTRRLTAEEKTFIPESEYGKVFLRAYVYLAIYAAVIGLAVYTRSVLPLMYVGLPAFYGSWLQFIYGHTQHAGLAEDVLDHRLNTRTIYMNPVNRYLYWQMNYHLEHHMFPLVPYYNLAKLHQLVKADMPRPYRGLWEAWREMLPAMMRQRKDPAYYVRRELPTPALPAGGAAARHAFTAKGEPVNGWIEVCAGGFLKNKDAIRVDHEGKTYAIYRTAAGRLYATDGLCTHGNAHLADGLVSGTLIECPKHHGRFDITDGSPQRQPAAVALKTYAAAERDGKIFLAVGIAGGER